MKIYCLALFALLLPEQSAFADNHVEFGLTRDLHQSLDLSFSHSKSNKTGKLKKSPKTSKTFSFSVDTKSQKLTPFSKTSKEAAADVTSGSEDNVLGMEDDAKSAKISPKVVLATELVPSNSNIAVNVKNAADTYEAGAFLAATIVGAFSGMIFW